MRIFIYWKKEGRKNSSMFKSKNNKRNFFLSFSSKYYVKKKGFSF